MRWCCVPLVAIASLAWAAESVALRAEPFAVPPSTGPVTHVVVRNPQDAPWSGTVAVEPPEGWRLSPGSRAVEVAPGQTQRVPFTVEKATDAEANRYRLSITASNGQAKVTRTQDVFCASAPYLRPKVDGKTGDWADSIPVTFLTDGLRTVVHTCWNRQAFCLLVEVEEKNLLGYRTKGSFDAVQVAIAPREAATGAKPTDPVQRYEFLLANSGSIWHGDRCWLLAKPGLPLSETQTPRARVEAEGARVVVKRSRGVTRYEASIPLALMPTLRATEGREFRFSVVVHDPDGTGVRDLGDAAGLWPSQRNRLAWSVWDGMAGRPLLFDSKIEWGFCSSKH